MFEGAEGDTWQEKVNAMRREQYAENREKINEQKRAAYAARTMDRKMLRKRGDPLLDVLGPASQSHPAEIERIKKRAESLGVEIIGQEGNMAYAPGLKSGQHGQLHVSRTDSYGARIHEEQHMNDDMQDGWPGFEGLFDIDRRCTMEYNAYRKEVELAKSLGREDIADELRGLCRGEIERIGGAWDESKLQ